MKHIKPFSIKIIFALLLFASMGCSPLKPCKVVKVVSFNIAESKGFGVTINTDLELMNPNRKSFTIQNSDIDVYVEGVYLGKLKIPENLVVPAKKNYLAHLSIDVSFNNMLMAGSKAIKKIRSGSFEVSFKGKLEVRYMLFNKVIVVDATNKVEM